MARCGRWLETSTPVQERAVDFNRGIPTTRMGFGSEPVSSMLEYRAVADGAKPRLLTLRCSKAGMTDAGSSACPLRQPSGSNSIPRTPCSRPTSWLRHSSLPDVLISGAHPLEVNDGVRLNSPSLV